MQEIIMQTTMRYLLITLFFARSSEQKGIYSDDSVPSQLSCYDIPSRPDFTISQIITPDLSATYASIVFS